MRTSNAKALKHQALKLNLHRCICIYPELNPSGVVEHKISEKKITLYKKVKQHA